MRVYIATKSPLLKKTLEIFLKDLKTDEITECDFCVSDKKVPSYPTFIIGKHIKHPFTKNELVYAIKEFFHELNYTKLEKRLNLTLKEIKNLQSKKIENLAKRLR